jgi:hypothetical protein
MLYGSPLYIVLLRIWTLSDEIGQIVPVATLTPRGATVGDVQAAAGLAALFECGF